MRFRRIDASNLGDHTYLREGDQCFYLHEYTSGQGFGFGEANDLVSNLKKSVARRGKPEYRYKVQAIAKCASLLSGAINAKWLKFGTIVPVPPSKAKVDALYDDRVMQMCQAIASASRIDIREIIRQAYSTRASHESHGNRLTVAELEAAYEIDENLCTTVPKSIVVLDDLLTVGTHYRAMHNILSIRFPKVPIVGMFIARRVFPTVASEFDDL